MKILAIFEGAYGERIINNIENNMPEDWWVTSFTPPDIAEPVVDYPEEYLPQELPQVDLILHMAENSQAPQLLPEIVDMSGAKGVIASIDDSSWIPPGLRNQLEKQLGKKGVAIVFPKPLCSINEGSCGFEDSYYEYESEIIEEFSRYFGRPKFDVTLDEENKIKKVEVLRGAPCGATHYTVKKIKGMSVDEVTPKAGLMSIHYPCLASMEFEKKKEGNIDTIMHISGKIFNEELDKAMGKD
ncbi:DUF166 domain-containing protein [Natranaerofaba carboxydovora]|uniref:DUF166 domain-containing protein n=1 Tax=Natranaerofaba carboxydovora TaxID=2742683 RepID=UPI001F13FC85|nr:DUF166 domain-containing protein [Natranaerofaba carboxydovora]UMZ72504.1 hypothetical protein ACONDI_00023 [Natranaerofaba carboxydovora]